MRNNMWNVFRFGLFTSLLVLEPANEARAQTLVKDIFPGVDTRNEGSYPDLFVTVGSTAYFAANNPRYQQLSVLWRTDGTAAGTVPVHDFVIDIEEIVAVRSTLFIRVASTGALWKSDGTPAGTVVVRNFDAFGDMAVAGPYVYFAATGGREGGELWRSDGTPQGTVLVADIRPGPESSWPRDLVSDGRLVFFSADDGVEGRELWVAYGTTVQQFAIRVGSGGSSPSYFTRVGTDIYFAADDGRIGGELYRASGGTVGLVADIHPGPPGSNPRRLTAAGGTLFLSADDGTHGFELWAAASGSARMVDDLNPGPQGSGPIELVAAGSDVFFSAHDGTTGWQLYRSDGTARGTARLTNTASGYGWPRALAVIPTGMLFSAPDPAGSALWHVPLAGSPISLVARVKVGFGLNETKQRPVGALGNSMLFGGETSPYDEELWASDGTPAGTRRIADLLPPQPNSAYPGDMVAFDDRLFFGADDGASRGLWASDGTAAGTVLVSNNVSWPGSGPRTLVATNDQLFFFADDGVIGNELWKTDGKTVELVRDIQPGPGTGAGFSMARLGGRVFLSADDGVNGRELWTSNGTASGTYMVKDIHPQGSGLGGTPFVGLDGITYFFADDGQNGTALWRTDRSPGGTTMVAAIPGGHAASTQLVKVAKTLFFVARTANEGSELWASDGTAQGTRLVKDIVPGPSNSAPGSLTAANGLLFFTATEPGSGNELWVSDGTAAGTRIVVDRVPGPGSSYPMHLTRSELALYFSAWHPATGLELYKSLGTAGTTVLVEDVNPGPATGAVSLSTLPSVGPLGSSPRAVFAADRGTTGSELWSTDGTSSGTRELANLAPDPWSSYPMDFVRVGRQLFFTAETPRTGRELWVVDVAVAGGVLGERYGTASVRSNGGQARIDPVQWPTLGNASFQIKLRDATRNTAAWILMSGARDELTLAPPMGGAPCAVYVREPWLDVQTATDANGEACIPLPIPLNSSLAGVEVFCQFVYQDTGGCFLSLLSFSDGLHVLMNY